MPALDPRTKLPGARRALLLGLLLAAGLREPAVADDLAGAVVESFDAPCDRPAGIGWDSGSLWLVCDSGPAMIYRWDPVTETVVDSFSPRAADAAFGLDHDGTKLWGDTEGPEVVYSADDADGTVLSFFDSPFAPNDPNGVAWDGSALWHSGFGEDLKLLGTSGAVLRTIPSPGIHGPRDMAVVAGELWVVDADINPADGIYRLRPEDGSVTGYFQPTGATFELIYGLAFDGTSFWMTDLLTDQIHRLTVNFELFDDDFESNDLCEWSARQGGPFC